VDDEIHSFDSLAVSVFFFDVWNDHEGEVCKVRLDRFGGFDLFDASFVANCGADGVATAESFDQCAEAKMAGATGDENELACHCLYVGIIQQNVNLYVGDRGVFEKSSVSCSIVGMYALLVVGGQFQTGRQYMNI
jgi:hypothetical protein